MTDMNMTTRDHQILGMLAQNAEYEDIAAETNTSRGTVWRVAVKHQARKHEARIRERADERRARQLETLQALVNRTNKADVLDFLDGIPDDSVNLFLTSIPYNVGKKYGESASSDQMRHVFYHGFIMQVLSEASRILKPGGTLFLQVGSTRDWQDRLLPIDVMLFEDIRRTGLTFQSRIVWTLPHGLTPKKRLAERYETVLVCSKGDVATFNPSVARKPQRNPGKRAFKGANKGQLSGHPLGAWPTNVWDDIPSVRHNHPDAKFGKHPAQFPVGLAKRAIMLYTQPGDLVCDPFAGSGSSHVAAIETGRAFVGADLFYEDLRARRVAHAKADDISPLPGISDETLAVWQAEARRVEVLSSEITSDQEALLMKEVGL